MTTHTTSPTVPDAWNRELKTQSEQYAAGKALRDKAPLSSHAEWAADPERPDPISTLEEANKTRLQHLVSIRFGRMSASPFAFYRGTADIMAYDLAKTPSPASGRRSVVMRTSRISVPLPLQNASWSSMSTTSTKRLRVPGNGM